MNNKQIQTLLNSKDLTPERRAALEQKLEKPTKAQPQTPEETYSPDLDKALEGYFTRPPASPHDPAFHDANRYPAPNSAVGIAYYALRSAVRFGGSDDNARYDTPLLLAIFASTHSEIIRQFAADALQMYARRFREALSEAAYADIRAALGHQPDCVREMDAEK